MLDIQKKEYAKYILFTSLYFSQGISLAITTVIVPLFLLNQGFSPAVITTAASIIMIPWILKFIFGWFVDTFQRLNKKQYTIYGGVTCALALILTSGLHPSSNLFGFIIILFISQCGIGLLDISMDAWVITETTKNERGKLNGTMMAGFFTGVAIGSAALTYIAEQNSFPIAFVTAGLITLILLIFPIITQKPPIQQKKRKTIELVLKEFKKKQIISFAILLPIISINSGIITLAAPLFMGISLELSITHIGLITTIFTISRILGSIIGGFLSDITTRHKTLTYIVITSIAFSAMLSLVNNATTMLLLYGIIGFLNGGLFTVLIATSMDYTNIKVGALQFSIFMSIMNSGQLFGEFISGPLITILGFARMFLFSAWILGPSLLFMYFTIKKRYFTT